MKVVVNGNTIYTRWQYDDVEVPTKKGSKQTSITQQTTCIATMNGSQIGSTSIRRYYKDPIDKELARKESLRRLLEVIFPGFRNKDIRKDFWQAYLNRKTPKPTVETPVVAMSSETEATSA